MSEYNSEDAVFTVNGEAIIPSDAEDLEPRTKVGDRGCFKLKDGTAIRFVVYSIDRPCD